MGDHHNDQQQPSGPGLHVQFNIGESPRVSRENTEDDLHFLQDLLHQANQRIFTPTTAFPRCISTEYSPTASSPPYCSFATMGTQKAFIPPKQVLVELYDLELGADETIGAWVESARWIKYEEDVEGVDGYWGKPHVAFLSFHSLMQLKKYVTSGVVLLEDSASSLDEVYDHVARAMTAEGYNPNNTPRIISVLKMQHTHVLQRRHLHRSSVDRRWSQASIKLTTSASAAPLTSNGPSDSNGYNIAPMGRQLSFQHPPRMRPEIIDEDDETKPEGVVVHRTGAVPHNSLSSTAPIRLNSVATVDRRRNSIMDFFSNAIGHTIASTFSVSGELAQHRSDVFRKLPEGVEAAQVFVGTVKELTRTRFVMVRLAEPITDEGPIPTRFVFVIIGPKGDDLDYHELGRAIATLMTNKHFKHIAYEAANRQELVRALDRFLDDSLVIPPGEVDSKGLLSGEEIQRAMKRRKRRRATAEVAPVSEEPKNGYMAKRPRTVSNARRHRFFNGLIEDVSNRLPKYWSDIRDAFTFQCITSVVFMFFASFAPAITFGGLLGQYTKDRIGTTETLLAQCICGIIWGIFSCQPLLIMSATGPVLIFEASLYTFCENLGLDFLSVRLWAGIWVILIAVVTVALDGSMLLKFVTRFTEDIFAALISTIFIAESLHFLYQTFHDHPVRDFQFYQAQHKECHNSTLSDCRDAEPNAALLTAIVLLATFAMAYGLKQLRTSYYLGRQLRRGLGDFGVLISIVVVAIVFQRFAPNMIASLEMPDHIGFTNRTARGHGIFVSMVLPADKWWGVAVAGLAGMLVFILLFVETEITELLLMRKDRKLVKGSGMNWDLLLMGVCTLLCSILGLPWMCAAAVQSLAHCGSLTVMKKVAPGERPEVERVIEQRVTTIGVSILIGAVAFGGKYIRLPVASLFGVFLYLGVMNLVGVQMMHRMVLFFMPKKYFPTVPYTQLVRYWKMHGYTWIQLGCLVFIYMVKRFKQTALAFPFVLIVFVIVRQLVLPQLFDKKELKALDGEEEETEEYWIEGDFYDNAPHPHI